MKLIERWKNDLKPEITKSSKAEKVKRKTVRGYLSPEPGDISEHENDILASAYASARESGKDKETSSKIAWAAVKRYRESKKYKRNTIIKTVNLLAKYIIEKIKT